MSLVVVTLRRWGLAASWVGLLLAPTAPQAAELTGQQVVLLQSNTELKQRIPSVDAYGDYVNAVRAQLTETFKAHTLPSPAAGWAVLAVRPGQQSRLWLDFEPPLPPELAQALTQRSQAVMPPLVREGPVLLALKLALDGAAMPTQATPEPTAWRLAATRAGRTLEAAEVVELLWDGR